MSKDDSKVMFYGVAGADGTIDLSELVQLFESTGIRATTDQVRTMALEYDYNVDGRIGFMEFTMLWERITELRLGGQGGSALTWTTDEVADWIERIGFPMYRACFTDQFITGKELQTVNASKLPRIGITDFDDIKVITKAIRELFGSLQPNFYRSVADVEWTPRNSLDGCTVGYGQATKPTAPYQPTPRWQVALEANATLSS